jgi:hypothetical protein
MLLQLRKKQRCLFCQNSRVREEHSDSLQAFSITWKRFLIEARFALAARQNRDRPGEPAAPRTNSNEPRTFLLQEHS